MKVFCPVKWIDVNLYSSVRKTLLSSVSIRNIYYPYYLFVTYLIFCHYKWENSAYDMSNNRGRLVYAS